MFKWHEIIFSQLGLPLVSLPIKFLAWVSRRGNEQVKHSLYAKQTKVIASDFQKLFRYKFLVNLLSFLKIASRYYCFGTKSVLFDGKIREMFLSIVSASATHFLDPFQPIFNGKILLEKIRKTLHKIIPNRESFILMFRREFSHYENIKIETHEKAMNHQAFLC